jgi:formyl-CoA transferase
MPGPLEGVRVLEFTEIIAGPFGGMLLADMGADVIKVEPPWGDPWRFAQPFLPNESKTFIGVNRGKRSLPLDMGKPEAKKIVGRLVPDMDVVLVNSRPDVPAKLGIDYPTLSKLNPRLIYCENTAFGRKGPHSHRPGYDIIAQAMTGLMAAEGKILNGVPQQIQSTPVADFGTGIAMAWGICAALYNRERTGKGQKIESTLLATGLSFQPYRFLQVSDYDDQARAEMLETIEALRESGASYDEVYAYYSQFRIVSLRVGNIYYRTYQAKDGALAVGCLSDPLRKRLAEVLDLRDIRFEPEYDASSDKAREFGEELVRKAEAKFREKTVTEWLTLLDDAGVPAGPVKFVEELLEDEQVKANGLVTSLRHTLAGETRSVGPMVQMSGTPLSPVRSSPGLGEHTEEILGGLGYSPEQIEVLRSSGVTR